MKLVNPTNKCIRVVSRLNGRWHDGVLPGDTVITDEVYKIRALMKHGMVEFKGEKVKKKTVKKKTVKKVVKPRRSRK